MLWDITVHFLAIVVTCEMCLQTVCTMPARTFTSSILDFDPGTLKIPSVLIPVCIKKVCRNGRREGEKEEERGGEWREEREDERTRIEYPNRSKMCGT